MEKDGYRKNRWEQMKMDWNRQIQKENCANICNQMKIDEHWFDIDGKRKKYIKIAGKRWKLMGNDGKR